MYLPHSDLETQGKSSTHEYKIKYRSIYFLNDWLRTINMKTRLRDPFIPLPNVLSSTKMIHNDNRQGVYSACTTQRKTNWRLFEKRISSPKTRGNSGPKPFLWYSSSTNKVNYNYRNSSSSSISLVSRNIFIWLPATLLRDTQSNAKGVRFIVFC